MNERLLILVVCLAKICSGFLDEIWPAPKVRLLGTAINNLTIVIDEPRQDGSIQFNFLSFDSKNEKLFHIRSHESNTVKLTDCRPRTLYIWYEKDKVFSNERTLYLPDHVKPKVPGYDLHGDQVTLNKGKNSAPLQHYLITHGNGFEYYVKGSMHEFTLVNKDKAVVIGMDACGLKSDSIVIEYGRQPAPVVGPIEYSPNGVIITVEEPEKDEGIQFHFTGVDIDGQEVMLSNLDEDNKLLLNQCGIVQVVITYTKDGDKSYDTVVDLPRDFLTEVEPKEPVQHFVDGKILLSDFQVERENLKYFYLDWDISDGYQQVSDDGVIETGCNTDIIVIWAEDECQRKSVIRRVELNHGECPPAPIVDIIGTTPGNMKIVVDDKSLDDRWIGFNFMAFDADYNKILDNRSLPSNELAMNECKAQSVVVWFSDIDNRRSISKYINLSYYTINNFQPNEPTQQIVDGWIRLTQFQVQNWTDQITYRYIPHYTNFVAREEEEKEIFAVLTDNIIEVEPGTKSVSIFAIDGCNERSMVKGVAINPNLCKPAKPIYSKTDKNVVTLMPGSDSVPLKGFKIYFKGKKSFKQGSEFQFVLNPTDRVIVQGVSQCNQLSDPIAIEYI